MTHQLTPDSTMEVEIRRGKGFWDVRASSGLYSWQVAEVEMDRGLACLLTYRRGPCLIVEVSSIRVMQGDEGIADRMVLS
ncbi:MAG: hypothetical protein V3S01_10850 [Dehalococcoidia bacterium]